MFNFFKHLYSFFPPTFQVVIKPNVPSMDEEEEKIKQEIFSGSTAVPELPPKVVRIFVSSTFVGRY